jgi:hypothetical protein
MAEAWIWRDSAGTGPLTRFSPNSHVAVRTATTATNEPAPRSIGENRLARAAAQTLRPTTKPAASPIPAIARNVPRANTACRVWSSARPATFGARTAPRNRPANRPA